MMRSNPLATPEQAALDELAIEIYEDNSFYQLRRKATNAYILGHGNPVSEEAQSFLNQTIDELVFSAIQKAVNNDPYHPKVYFVNAAPHTWFGLNVPGGRYCYDNPDTIYRTIPINGSEQYIIRGQRYKPAPSDVSFSLIRNVNSQRTIAILTDDELKIEEDGSYEITIDNSPANGRPNHIQSNEHAKQLFIRNSLGDWVTQTPDALTVELIGSVISPPPTQSQIVSWAKKNLLQSILDYGIGALGIKTMRQDTNTLSAPKQSNSLGTLVTQASSFGHFVLSEDQALIATLTPGGASYFVFPATQPWMITVDPGSYQCSLNGTQAIANPDGTYIFVLSRKDPKVYNWISTSNLNEGTIMARWQNLASTNSDPAITTQVSKLSELDQILPPSTKFVTPEQRQEQLAFRAKGYARRFSQN